MNDTDRNLIINMWSGGCSKRQIIQMLPYTYEVAESIVNSLVADGTLTKEKKGRTVDKVLELYEKIKNPYEIADRLGARPQTVSQILANARLNRTRPEHNYKKRKPVDIATLNEKTQIIVNELRNGKKQAQVAREQNVSKQYVSKIYYNYVNNKNGE